MDTKCLSPWILVCAVLSVVLSWTLVALNLAVTADMRLC